MSDSWRMSAEDAEEYTRALGQVMSGGWRQLALGLKLDVPAALNLTPEAWVRERIGGAIRMGLEERREAAREMADKEGEFGFRQVDIAAVLGVDQATVSRDLRDYADASRPEGALEEGDAAEYADASAADCPEAETEPEPEPETEPAPEPEPSSELTAGDVEDEIAARMDDAGVAEEIADGRRLRTMRQVRLGWLRFIGEHPPGALSDGMDRRETDEVIRDLERIIGWMQQGRDVARGRLRPRRVGA